MRTLTIFDTEEFEILDSYLENNTFYYVVKKEGNYEMLDDVALDDYDLQADEEHDCHSTFVVGRYRSLGIVDEDANTVTLGIEMNLSSRSFKQEQVDAKIDYIAMMADIDLEG